MRVNDMSDTTDWNIMIKSLLEMTREYESAPSWAMTMKLTEEVGELNEVMLYEHGFLKYKDKVWKDTPVEESADILNTVLGMLSAHYPDKTPEEISKELFEASLKKGKKYGRILGADTSLFT